MIHETFEHDGREYRLRLEPDDLPPPWKWSGGCGEVSEWVRRDKRPGERVLMSDRGSYRYYDVQATMRVARRDGWGLSPGDKARLAGRLGRPVETLTAGEVCAAAVEADFERLRAWCNGDWEYVCIRVTDDEGESAYLGGVESDCHDFIMECARELADGLHPLANAIEAAGLELATD